MFRWLCAAAATARAARLTLGVQSHWPHGEPYASVGGADVLSLARELGASRHRTCFSAADVEEGSATAAALAEFAANLTTNGAELLATLYCDPACNSELAANASVAYAGCEQYAYALASSAALQNVSTWELGNEGDQRCLVGARAESTRFYKVS